MVFACQLILATFKNRNGKTQTFTFDALNRMSYFTWADNLTPRVDFGYDIASRLITIDNANATISRTYFNDNLLNSETETTGVARTVTYSYDADGNRASLQFPGYSFSYNYTGRNQLKNIISGTTTLATYGYDLDGNLTSRDLGGGEDGSTSTDYLYDALDRVTSVTHALNGTTRTFAYGYDNVGNRKWTKRDQANGDVFSYDLADQVSGVQLDVPNPDEDSSIPRTVIYDANGNRTSFSPYGTTDTYTINNLSQYTSRNTINAVYDNNGNLITGVDGSFYTYDAQNRLLTASKDGVTYAFTYDGLNRQVGRTTGGPTRYSVWDGWDLVQEYQGQTEIGAYLYGPSGLVKNLLSGNYYYQDGSGSTSHLADSSGALLEWYRYDLQGTPIFYNANNTQIPSSNYGVRHLFTGQQWCKEVGLYDLRNRFYSPDIGRFPQPDPIGFAGDPTNLYRYCGNNPVTWSDPSGLEADWLQRYGVAESEAVVVNGAAPRQGSPTGVGAAAPFFTIGGSSGGHGIGGVRLESTIARDRNGRKYDPNNGFNIEMHPWSEPGVAETDPVTMTGTFVPAMMPGSGLWSLLSGGPSWSPFWRWVLTDRNNSGVWVQGVSQFGRDHLSLDVNVNALYGGINVNGSSRGGYAAGGVGPGEFGEATLTLNLNFGTPPQGFYGSARGAVGIGFPAGGFSVGWAPGTGFYGSFGAGIGYAAYLGGNLGYGGYFYRPGGG